MKWKLLALGLRVLLSLQLSEPYLKWKCWGSVRGVFFVWFLFFFVLFSFCFCFGSPLQTFKLLTQQCLYAQFIYTEKGFFFFFLILWSVQEFSVTSSPWERGWGGDQGRFSSRATPGVSMRYSRTCVSFVFDRKCICKNAAQGKDLKLLASAVLGVDAGRCHANSWIIKHFLLHLIQWLCVLLTARKKISPLFSDEDYASFIFPIDWHYCGCVFIHACPVNNKCLLAEHCYSLLLNIIHAKPDPHPVFQLCLMQTVCWCPKADS